MLTRKKLISLIIFVGLLFSLFMAVYLVGKRQEIRKRAGASNVTLSLYPASETLNIGETKPFDLIATFTGGSSTETIDYLKTEINFSTDYLRMPNYADTEFPNQTNFTKIFRVDGPQAANETGKIIIELGVDEPNTGPPTDQPLTVARIYFEGKAQTPSAQDLTIGTAEVVNNQSTIIPPTFTGATYTVGQGGPAATPTPTITPGGPTLTPTPTLVGSAIDIGDKDSLLINIGGGVDPDTVHVHFGVKLFGAEGTPEIKVRLKIVDLVAQLTPAPAPADSCQDPGPGEYFYKDIPLVADGNGVYHPKAGASFDYGSYQLPITSGGWIPLLGVNPGRIYSISVKGPKHRNVKMVDNFKLEKGNPSSQDFDWTSHSLEPGDVPNPNIGNQQDCIVNSIDLSLIIDRIGSTDTNALTVADVNYDGVVNGNDISQVVNTLSTKPDDD